MTIEPGPNKKTRMSPALFCLLLNWLCCDSQAVIMRRCSSEGLGLGLGLVHLFSGFQEEKLSSCECSEEVQMRSNSWMITEKHKKIHLEVETWFKPWKCSFPLSCCSSYISTNNVCVAKWNCNVLAKMINMNYPYPFCRRCNTQCVSIKWAIIGFVELFFGSIR